jgi:hypothetical protein
MAKYTFSEQFDRNALFHITRNFSTIYKPNPEKQMSEKDLNNILVALRTYLKRSNSDGTITITYEQKKYNKNDKFGRMYPFPQTALQSIPREIRNAIAKTYVNDIDIENAQPTLLLQLCNKKNISCPMLTDYVNHRDEWLSNIDPQNRSRSKKLIIKTMFGGDVSNATFDKIQLLKSEINSIVSALANLHENNKFAKLAKNKNYKHYYSNESGSFLSYILQDLENNVLLECIEYCNLNNIRINSLIFDGFTINKDDTIDLNALSVYVNEKIGYNVKFALKPMETSIIIPENALDLSNKIDYETVKVNFEQHCAKVMNPIVFIDNDIILSREHLKHKYENLIYHKVKKDEYVPTSFINDWLQDVDMKTYNGIGLYPPPLVCPSDFYNMYIPYCWNNYNGERNDNIDVFMTHLNVMVNGDNNAFNYVLKWIAHILQKPGIKTETMISFVGAEGIGKSQFMKLLTRLVGDDKLMETNNPENTIFGKFANWNNKTVCVLNDFNVAETRGCNREMFKQFITETKFTQEKKGVDSFESKNYTNFISTTNTYNPVHKTEESRRYFVCETSASKKGDFEYFRKLNEYMENDANIAGLFHFLINMDLNDFNVRFPPNTLIGDIIAQENANPFEMFVDEYNDKICKLVHYRREDENRGFIKCHQAEEGSMKVISQRELYSCFSSWCNENNMDLKKFNSKKLQTEMFRKRDSYKLEYRVNKNNSSLSMWIVANDSKFDKPLQSRSLDFIEESDDE